MRDSEGEGYVILSQGDQHMHFPMIVHFYFILPQERTDNGLLLCNRKCTLPQKYRCPSSVGQCNGQLLTGAGKDRGKREADQVRLKWSAAHHGHLGEDSPNAVRKVRLELPMDTAALVPQIGLL